MTDPLAGRPRPIVDAASKVTKVIGAAGALLSLAASIGLLTQTQGDALATFLALIAPVITAVVGALAAFGVVHLAEPLVTPLSSPVSAEGVPLVEQPPAPQAGTQGVLTWPVPAAETPGVPAPTPPDGDGGALG